MADLYDEMQTIVAAAKVARRKSLEAHAAVRRASPDDRGPLIIAETACLERERALLRRLRQLCETMAMDVGPPSG